MTFRMALKHIRKAAPEVEETFRIICRNRYCHPVRKWSIYDLAKHEKLSRESAERRYYRHLARLQEIFVSVRSAISGGACDRGEVRQRQRPLFTTGSETQRDGVRPCRSVEM